MGENGRSVHKGAGRSTSLFAKLLPTRPSGSWVLFTVPLIICSVRPKTWLPISGPLYQRGPSQSQLQRCQPPAKVDRRRLFRPYSPLCWHHGRVPLHQAVILWRLTQHTRGQARPRLVPLHRVVTRPIPDHQPRHLDGHQAVLGFAGPAGKKKTGAKPTASSANTVILSSTLSSSPLRM